MHIFFSIFLFLIPLVYSFSTNQVFEINKFSLLLGFIGGILFLHHPIFQTSRRHNICLLGFLALSFLVSVLAQNPVISFFGSTTRHMGFFTLLALVYIFLISQKIATQKLEKFLIIPIFTSSLLIIFYAVYQWIQFPSPDFLFGELDARSMSYRSFAFLGQPNFIAQISIFPFFIGLEKLKTSAFFLHKKIIFGILSGLLFGGMLLATDSRAGILAFFVGIGLYFFKNNIIKTLFLVFPFLIWLATLTLGSFFHSSERFASIIARSHFWQDAFSLVFHNPKIFFFGAGFDNLSGVWQSTLSYESYASEYFQMLPDRVHSLFLDIWVQGGIFLLLIIGFGVCKTTQKTWNTQFLLAPFLGMITTWMFGFFVITDAVFMAVLLGIIWKNEIETITSLSFLKRISVKIIYQIIGLLFIAIASVSWLSDKSFFERKEFALHYTPFLENNWVSLYSELSENEQKEIREIGNFYHWNSRGFYRILFLESLKIKDNKAKDIAFQNWWNATGNNPVEQLKILKEIKSFGIGSDDEYNTQVQKILEKLPKETDPSFEAQKIWNYLHTL